MKVLAINGSPHVHGTTDAALQELCAVLKQQNIETEVVHLGSTMLHGCTACGQCRRQNPPRCIFNDIVNECIEKMHFADGLILGSPVYYAGIAGSMKCFIDRFFFACPKEYLEHKVGTTVVALRRSGGVATFDQLNHYLTLSNMVVTSSQYWNVIHGHNAEEAHQDAEGMQIMRTAGQSMAYVLKKLRASPDIQPPADEPRVTTNFIR